MPTSGTVKVLVLLIDFADTPHIPSDTNAVVTTAINGTPATGFPYESLHNFYDRSSYGQLNIEGTVLDWYTTAYNRSAVVQDYAGRDNLIKEALNSFKAAGHDFAQYDNDGDGYIDYFAVVWAGDPGDWATFWWGYQTVFSDGSYMLDGKHLGTYSWQWESYNYPSDSFSPRALIHETGHALGLPDLYDYDDAIGPKGGVGGLDQMDANWGDHNSFSKYVLDWLTPTLLTSGATNVTLDASSSTKNCVIAMPGIVKYPFQEYFVIQNRDRSGNDTYYPKSGLLIWHVDARLDSDGWDYVYNNSFTDHKLVRLMEADGLEEIEKDISANAGDYYVPGKFFTPASMPNSKRYIGTSTNLNVTNITASGSQRSRSADISFLEGCTYSISPTSATVGRIEWEWQCFGNGIGRRLFMDGDEQCGVDYDHIWEQRYGEWDGELFLYGQQYGSPADGNHYIGRPDLYPYPADNRHHSSQSRPQCDQRSLDPDGTQQLQPIRNGGSDFKQSSHWGLHPDLGRCKRWLVQAITGILHPDPCIRRNDYLYGDLHADRHSPDPDHPVFPVLRVCAAGFIQGSDLGGEEHRVGDIDGHGQRPSPPFSILSGGNYSLGAGPVPTGGCALHGPIRERSSDGFAHIHGGRRAHDPGEGDQPECRPPLADAAFGGLTISLFGDDLVADSILRIDPMIIMCNGVNKINKLWRYSSKLKKGLSCSSSGSPCWASRSIPCPPGDEFEDQKLPGTEIGGILSTFGLSKNIGPFPVVANICADNQQGRFFGLLSHSKKKTETLFMAIQRCTERLRNSSTKDYGGKDLCPAE